jgi:hypothetical protein
MSDKYRGFWVGFVVGVGATLAALVVAIVVFAAPPIHMTGKSNWIT